MAASFPIPYIAAPRRHADRGYWWVHLSDRELLRVRLCDLGLSLERSVLKLYVQRLYAELAARDIAFRPHCWLADEWFSPDGVPGIAMPFYLAHPRLRRLERHMMREVEGGNDNWLMRLLRHEAGHAIDTAYRLRRRRAFRETFGPASLPYPTSYVPRPGSRRYVQHLGSWYAQSHPTEDFAETFAVWLKPASRWRRDYADWPALNKLLYVERTMQECASAPALVRNRMHIEPLGENRRTLGEHYERMRAHYHSPQARTEDAVLRKLFVAEPGRQRQRAAALLRQLRPRLREHLAHSAGCTDYFAHQVVRTAIVRADRLDLYVAGDSREAARNIKLELQRLAEVWQRGAGRRLAL